MHPPNSGQSPTQLVIAPQEQEESSFDFWGVLGRQKWLVFLGLVLGLAAGIFYNSRTATIFESTAKVRIEPKDPIGIQLGDKNQFGQVANFEIRHDQLIGEFNIISKCLLENELDNSAIFADYGDTKDADGKIIPAVLKSKVNLVKEGLTITQNRDEKILYEVNFQSKDPEASRDILAALITTYEKDLASQYDSSKADIQEIVRRWEIVFSKEFQDKKKELESVRKALPAFIVSNGNLNQHQVKMRELQDAMPRLQSELRQLSKKVELARDAIDGGEKTANDHVWWLINEGEIKAEDEQTPQNGAQVQRLETQLLDRQLALQELEDRYGSGHYKVQSMKKSIQEIETRISELKNATDVIQRRPPAEILRVYIDRNQKDIEMKQEEIRANIEATAFHTQKQGEIAENNQKIADLEAELASYRERADAANEQLIQLNTRENHDNNNQGFYFRTTEYAALGEKVWPVLPVILGVGGILGALLGFGVGWMVELADKTFHNPDQIIKQLQVPLIGHVPVIGQSKRYLVENSLIEPIVCTYHRPKSQVSEAFRAVRTALYFNTQGAKHAVIQVTSPTPGDGKSTLASNLAVSIAQSGKRVLLVDADMRRPRQHGTFGISSRTGFATVLSGQSEWRDTMFECEEIEGLTVMPCGAKPQNPAELSSSPQVKILIEEMRQEFDFVIIDTPPLLAVTDPCPIAARVDGVILCLRIKKNVRVSAERAVELLNNLGASCIGLVVNGVGAQSGYGSQYTYGAYQAGYSYNGYGYGYGYGYGSGKYYDEDQKGRVAEPRRIEGQPKEPSSEAAG